MRTNAPRRWLPRTVFGAAIVAALALSATPASAHNSLLGSTPAAGSVVTEQPGTISITTNDDLLTLGGEANALQVSGPSSAGEPLYYGDGCVTVTGPTMAADVQLGQPGEYTVVWKVVSIDSHPVSDQFTFDWQPAAGQPLAEGSPTAPRCGESAASSPLPDDGDPAGDVPPVADGAFADALWIGGAAVAVLLAAAATFVILIRRRPSTPPE